MTESPEEPDRVIIRDNRKIDPVTGQARTSGSGGAHAAPEPDDAVEVLAAEVPAAEAPPAEVVEGSMVEAALLDERTRDLQRVQAEYANYRKRADRERLAAGELAIGRALAELLPVLDDIERAKAHGDLTGALKAIADKLEGTMTKLGLEAFGAVGDPFDPAVHEAVLHEESDAVSEPTCTTVLRPGYKHHDRLLRPAMVGVTDPTTFAPAASRPADDPTVADANGATDAPAPEDVTPDPTDETPTDETTTQES